MESHVDEFVVEYVKYEETVRHDWARLWCLGHNLETAAALSVVRNLSWVRGWDSAITLGEFCEALKTDSAS